MANVIYNKGNYQVTKQDDKTFNVYKVNERDDLGIVNGSKSMWIYSTDLQFGTKLKDLPEKVRDAITKEMI